MILNSETGILRDCVAYSLFYFNKRNSGCFLNTGVSKRFFSEFRKCNILPPLHLAPFFYRDFLPCPISEYLFRNIHRTSDLVSFIDSIKDYNNFRRFIIDYMLSEVDEEKRDLIYIQNNLEDIEYAFREMKFENKVVDMYLNLFKNFNIHVDDLISYLDSLYTYVKDFHLKYNEIIEDYINELQSYKNSELSSEHFGINIDEYLNTYISVTLLDTNMIMIHKNNGRCSLVLGIYALDYLKDLYGYKHVTANSFFNIIGDKIRRNIIDLLKDPETKLNMSEIASKLGLSEHSVRKHLDALRGEMIVNSEDDGSYLIFSLNGKYFSRIYPIIKDYINDRTINIDFDFDDIDTEDMDSDLFLDNISGDI